VQNLQSGDYKLLSEGADHPSFVGSFMLQKGAKAHWEPYALGIISFSVVPDNSECAMATGTVLKTDEASAIAPGSFTAVLRRPGYHDQDISFTVLSGRRTVVTAKLEELARGSIVMPRQQIPLDIKISGIRISSKDGPEGTLVYDSIPCGRPISVSFVSDAFDTSKIPSLELSLSEGEKKSVDLPTGRFSLPWIPSGALIRIGDTAKIVLNNSGSSGYLSPPLPPGHYKIAVQEANLGDDFTIGVDIVAGSTNECADYATAMLAKLNTSKASTTASLKRENGKTNVGIAFLSAGLIGIAGAVTSYFIGNPLYEAYAGAVDSAQATARWNDLQAYRVIFGCGAGVGLVGLGVSPFIIFRRQNTEIFKQSINALDEGIRELSAVKE
jgi:hypothetical protein